MVASSFPVVCGRTEHRRCWGVASRWVCALHVFRDDSEGKPGIFVRVAGNEDFLGAWIVDADVHVVWSSQLHIDSAWGAIKDLCPQDAGGEAYVAAVAGSPSGFISLREAVNRIEESPAAIRGVRLEWADFTVTWDNASADVTDHAGMSFVTPTLNQDLCRNLIERTASPAVVEHLDEALQAVRPIFDRLHAGNAASRGGGTSKSSSLPPSVAYVSPPEAPFRRTVDGPTSLAL